MFEKYLVHPEGFRNVKKDDEVIGYELQLRIPYYRGIPMSCVEEIKLEIDRNKINEKDLKVTVEEETFEFEELSTAINHRWEMVDPITVFVPKAGGLEPGGHKVKGFVSLRISYQPHRNTGEDEKTLELEADKELVGGER